MLACWDIQFQPKPGFFTEMLNPPVFFCNGVDVFLFPIVV